MKKGQKKPQKAVNINDTKKSIPKGLKRLRNERGLTQNKIAELINCDTLTYSRYERGERIPPLEVLLWFANEFQCSFDYVIGKDNCRSVDNQYIQDELGLSDDSINAIKHAAKHNDDDIKTFNFICNSSHGGKLDLHFLLSYIRSYITGEYTTPVQYDPISKKYFVPYWQDRDNIVLYARDKKHLQDVKGLPLSESISETITLKDIEKLLNELKKIWNNKKG